MKEDFKLCMKLLKYSYNYKEERNLSIIFILVGLLMLVGGLLTDTLSIAASMWFMLGPTLYIKAIFSLSYSHLACACGKRRFLEVTFPNIWTIAGVFISTFIVLVITGIYVAVFPERLGEYCRWLIWSSLMNSVVLLFYGVSSKLFWQGLVFVTVGMITYMFAEIFWDAGFAGFTSFLPAAVISFLIMMGCAGLSCWLRVLLYKRPVVRGKIGKEMMGVQ